MKVKIDRNLCIGCGACQATEPKVFELDDEGIAQVIDNEINDSLKDNVINAINACPTSAISEINE